MQISADKKYKKGADEMFNINDIVTYGISGVCKIVEITEKDLTGVKKTYLVLKPMNGEKSTYYVPVDNEKQLSKMRKTLTADEVNFLIDSMPNAQALWVEDERERKDCYRKVLADAKPEALIRMTKALYCEKRAKEAQGKKLHIADERFFKDAQKLLYDEFQYVLNLSEEGVTAYILSRIEKIPTDI